MGYDVAQGYFFAKPMKSADFAAMLMAQGHTIVHQVA